MNTKLYSVFKDVVITREPDRHSVPITYYTRYSCFLFVFCLQSHINMTGLRTDISAGPIIRPF